MPPVNLPMASELVCSSLRNASFTAATSVSDRVSMSSGSTISGFMSMFRISFFPLIFTVTTTTPTAEVMTTKVGDQEVRIGKTDYILKSEYIEFSDGTIVDVQWGE